MRLTVFTDYAFRVLMFVALKADGLSTIDDIARGYGISKNHLRKVVHDLSQHGYLDTVQGRRGGIRLSRPAAEIRLDQVVRDMEQDMRLVECFDRAAGQCRVTPACTLCTVFYDALDGFMNVLKRHTIADLIGPRHALAGLLGVDLASAAAPAPARAPRTRAPRRADPVAARKSR